MVDVKSFELLIDTERLPAGNGRPVAGHRLGPVLTGYIFSIIVPSAYVQGRREGVSVILQANGFVGCRKGFRDPLTYPWPYLAGGSAIVS